MIVTATLCWWNEDPSLLEACLRSVTIADRIVAFDGAYARYPGATVRSPEEQAQVIRDFGGEVVVPDRLWKGQCEKRTAIMQRAAEGSDWIAVVDADWIVHADRESVRAQLADSTADAYSAPFTNPPNPGSTLAPSLWHQDQLRLNESHVVLYRALPGMRAEGLHYYISAMKGPERVWLQSDGPQDYADPPVPRSGRTVPHPQINGYEIEHRWAWRSDAAKLRERAFENDRWMVFGMTGQEDDRDDLPAPVYNDEIMPV